MRNWAHEKNEKKTFYNRKIRQYSATFGLVAEGAAVGYVI
jgi:hypothetical protein